MKHFINVKLWDKYVNFLRQISPHVMNSTFFVSHLLVSPSFYRRWLPWLRWELRIPTLWGSPHGSSNEGAWRKKLWAWVRTSSPSSWRVWCPCWFSSGDGVRTGARQDECRPCLQHLLPLWQCRAGEKLIKSCFCCKKQMQSSFSWFNEMLLYQCFSSSIPSGKDAACSRKLVNPVSFSSLYIGQVHEE